MHGGRDTSRIGDRFEDRFADLAALSYRVAYRLTGDRGTAEDLCQEALARAYRSALPTRPEPPVRGSSGAPAAVAAILSGEPLPARTLAEVGPPPPVTGADPVVAPC